jgi:hypothetical protein
MRLLIWSIFSFLCVKARGPNKRKRALQNQIDSTGPALQRRSHCPRGIRGLIPSAAQSESRQGTLFDFRIRFDPFARSCRRGSGSQRVPSLVRSLSQTGRILYRIHTTHVLCSLLSRHSVHSHSRACSSACSSVYPRAAMQRLPISSSHPQTHTGTHTPSMAPRVRQQPEGHKARSSFVNRP